MGAAVALTAVAAIVAAPILPSRLELEMERVAAFVVVAVVVGDFRPIGPSRLLIQPVLLADRPHTHQRRHHSLVRFSLVPVATCAVARVGVDAAIL